MCKSGLDDGGICDLVTSTNKQICAPAGTQTPVVDGLDKVSETGGKFFFAVRRRKAAASGVREDQHTLSHTLSHTHIQARSEDVFVEAMEGLERSGKRQ